MDEIVNRVASSSLVTIDLEDYYNTSERVEYDIAQNLFQGMILKEKDFRAHISSFDWSVYKDKIVNIICSADAVVPTWAYMLLVTKLESVSSYVYFCNREALEIVLFKDALSKIDYKTFEGSKVVVKGCGKFPIPTFAYAEITRCLLPYVQSIMYGEPCSTVPVYKKNVK